MRTKICDTFIFEQLLSESEFSNLHAHCMSRFFLFLLIVTASVVGLIALDRADPIRTQLSNVQYFYSQSLSRFGFSTVDSLRSEGQATNSDATVKEQFDTELLLDLESYEDPDYGFSMAIPSGWRKIVAAESEENFDELEPGYAVGFESPYQGENDQFADYVLIEVLPGKDSGLFKTDGENRRRISIDGRNAWMDRLEVTGESGGLTEVDLTIFQAQMSGLGYTIGLYAIGEPSREKLMLEAFEIIVRTFKQATLPFPVS